MTDWVKYTGSGQTKANRRPLRITFQWTSYTIQFYTPVSCFSVLGIRPRTRVDLYFVEDRAAIVPNKKGKLVWRQSGTTGAAFRNKGWDVSHGTTYACEKGRVNGKPALIIKQDGKR